MLVEQFNYLKSEGHTLSFLIFLIFRLVDFDSWVLFGFHQEDVFQTVGVPLVKNALAGYNTSILSYGQVCIESLD